MNEMRVGTRELKSKLSEYMWRVKFGQTIVVTEHGKPIGQEEGNGSAWFTYIAGSLRSFCISQMF
jgi:hypothetical protein